VGVFEGKNRSWQMLENVVGSPARWLRETVTRSPEFMIANMLRDSLSVWAMGGGPTVPIASTMKRSISNLMSIPFRRAEKGDQPSPYSTTTKSYEILSRGSAVGGFELSATHPRKLKRVFAAATGQKSATDNLFRIWDAFGEVSAISEAATRELVYEETYERLYNRELIAKYPDENERRRVAEGEAIFQALEVLNFSRRGSNPLVQLTAAAIPFLNARFQGIDRLARAAFLGEGIGEKQGREAKMQLIQRGVLLGGVSMLYAMLHYDDEDFDKVRPEIQDDNWLIKLPWKGQGLAGSVPAYFAIPIPFEVGVIFKIWPEHLTKYMLGGTSDELARGVKDSLANTMQLTLVPQIVKPLIETVTNYNFFTGGSIVPEYMKPLGGYGARPTTSETARVLGEATGVSPLKIEHLVRGYFAQWGVLTLNILDLGMKTLTGKVEPSMRVTDLVGVHRFIRLGEGGLKTRYYEQVSQPIANAYAIVREIAKTDPEAAREFAQKNKNLLALRSTNNAMKRRLDALRNRKKQAWLAGARGEITPERLREIDDSVTRAEHQVLSNVPLLLKLISE